MMASGVRAWVIQAPMSRCWSVESSRLSSISSSVFSAAFLGALRPGSGGQDDGVAYPQAVAPRRLAGQACLTARAKPSAVARWPQPVGVSRSMTELQSRCSHSNCWVAAR
jgi:hypothetical protein